jgi:hypothetical protein
MMTAGYRARAGNPLGLSKDLGLPWLLNRRTGVELHPDYSTQ